MNHKGKLARFRALHEGALFIAPNPPDAGAARLLEGMGFPALATSSGALAIRLATRDSSALLSRDEVIADAAAIAAAVQAPVSADLENGFGDAPEEVAETIRAAFAAGLCGGAIEDATGRRDAPLYDIEAAAARIAAAAAAKPDPDFMLTARAENFLVGRPDIDDVIARLKAYEAAGADVLYAPGLPDLDAVKAVTGAVSKPVNVVLGLSAAPYDVTALAEAGVTRISTGGSFARAAFGAVRDAAAELMTLGTTTYADRAPRSAEVAQLMRLD